MVPWRSNWTQNQEHRDPESQKARDNTYNMLIEHTLNFNKDFGKHHVDAVVGTTYSTMSGKVCGLPV